MILKYPGYIHPKKDSFWHAGRHYKTFEALVRDLTEDEIGKMTAWHIKRGLGVGNRVAALLMNPKLRQA
jgi:hypothetical protein